MPLSNDMISQFAKLVNNKSNDKPKTTQTLVGTIVESDGKKWVKLDGSENLTPIESTDEDGNVTTQTTTEIEPNDRVTVEIKDHTATVTGNLTTPAASTKTTEKIGTKISEFDIIVGHRITVDDVNATNGFFENIKSNYVNTNYLTAEGITAIEAEIERLKASYIEGKSITATDIEALNADIENLKVKFAQFKVASVENLDAVNADIDQLTAYNGNFTYVSTEVLNAVKATINKLNVDKLEANWANIDYANIDIAKLGDFFAKSGILENITINDASVTGDLVSVNITGSLIKGGTIAADKLMILGEDGLYHRLNATTRVIEQEKFVKTETILDNTTEEIPNWIGTLVDGATTTTGEVVYMYFDSDTVVHYYCIVDGTVYSVDRSLTEVEEETSDYNSLNGRVIATNSITADKISVTDLLAFAATIGGFNIGLNSIFSGVKDEVNNTTRGIYLDTDGQVCIGDSNNYIKFYEENGEYKLDISASSLKFEDLDKLKALSTYVKMGSYTDPDTGDTDPCLELSEDESDDILRQTNKRIVFIREDKEKVSVGVDGVTHHVNTDEYNGKYVWSTRANGNFGLIWKDVSN